MTDNSNIDMGPIPQNAVSVIQDAGDDFPVLKAFQQYIDAEQDKARKRMISLCIFFGCLMTIVIAVFLFLLNGISQRNQTLNDRLLEFVMKDRGQSPVVVQPPTDNSAVLTLSAKIDEMQKKLTEAQHKADAAEQARQNEAEKAAAVAAAKEQAAAAREKARIKEEIEISRLKAQLAEERNRAAAEAEKKHQEEIEAYRRQHYPELYAKPTPPAKPVAKPAARPVVKDEADDAEITALIKDLDRADAIKYYDDDDEAEKKPAPKPAAVKKTESPSPSTTKTTTGYTIPVEVKGSKGTFRIPTR